jgi:hypothetical protein
MIRHLRTIALLASAALPALCVPTAIGAAPPPSMKKPAPKPMQHPTPRPMRQIPFMMTFPGATFPTNVLMLGAPPTTPFGINVFNRALSPYSAYASNPYSAQYGAYPMMMPAYYPMMGGYGSGAGGYGSGTNNSNPYTTDTDSYAIKKRQKSATDETGSLQSILGLPGEKGRLSWPLGLRILAPAPEAEALRQQIDGLIQSLAYQAGSGQVQSGTVDAATGATRDLRRLLRRGEGSAAIAEYTSQEAERFLSRLDSAIRSAGAVSSAGKNGY